MRRRRLALGQVRILSKILAKNLCRFLRRQNCDLGTWIKRGAVCPAAAERRPPEDICAKMKIGVWKLGAASGKRRKACLLGELL